MNGNERYILEGIIIVLIAAYIFYENVFMAGFLFPQWFIFFRQGNKKMGVDGNKKL